jgi:hypothetical protein
VWFLLRIMIFILAGCVSRRTEARHTIMKCALAITNKNLCGYNIVQRMTELSTRQYHKHNIKTIQF